MQKDTFHTFCFPTFSRSFATITQTSLKKYNLSSRFLFNKGFFFFFLEEDSGYDMTAVAVVTNQQTSQKQELHSTLGGARGREGANGIGRRD